MDKDRIEDFRNKFIALFWNEDFIATPHQIDRVILEIADYTKREEQVKK